MSGITSLVYNFLQATDRRKLGPSDKRIDNLVSSVPVVDRAVRRRALAIAASPYNHGTPVEDDQQAFSPEATPETVESLVDAIFMEVGGENIAVGAYSAAWKLASLMGSSNVRAAIARMTLNGTQLSLPRLAWLTRPDEDSPTINYPLAAVQGRIGFLIKKSRLKYLPPPPLAIDAYLAIGLIAVRESHEPYHSDCRVNPHDEDQEIIGRLYDIKQMRPDDTDDTEFEVDAAFLRQLKYRDIGKMLRPDLLHVDPPRGIEQTQFIAHIMRHFLNDDLSSILFDALSPGNQIRLAITMLTASRWMSPNDWKCWVATGRDRVYAPKLEMASNLSFAAAAGLAIGVIVMACWQIVEWVTYGWTWYFGSVHVLGTWPAWGKVVVFVIAAALLVTILIRLYIIGVTIGVSAGICLILAILASPAVRVHTWIPSWETSSAIVICAVAFTPILGWLGVFYSDQLDAEEPIQLGNIAHGRLSETPQRSRYRPEHEFGHETWCASL